MSLSPAMLVAVGGELHVGVDLVETETRTCVLAQVADRVASLPAGAPQLVAIDGVDGAGKSTFAMELSKALAGSGRPVVCASIDSFHNPREVRYRRGRSSPEGYYRDSFDLGAVKAKLLEPWKRGVGSTFRRGAFDEPSDRPVEVPPEIVTAGMVLIFDGVFAHRPELREYWDFSVLLEAEVRAHEEWLARLHRDLPAPGPARESELERRRVMSRRRRYVDGQALYFAEATPRAYADLVIDNNDLGGPVLL